MDDCVFCNIVDKTIESEIVFEDDDLVVIKDILPKAPVHLLIMPKKHIISINNIEVSDQALIGKMVLIAKAMAEKYGVSDTGYKLVFNVGRDGGMVVPHLHLHLMGGKKLAE